MLLNTQNAQLFIQSMHIIYFWKVKKILIFYLSMYFLTPSASKYMYSVPVDVSMYCYTSTGQMCSVV